MSVIAHPRVFRDTLPVANARILNITLVIGFALLAALAAQIRVPLGFTPVPVTLQTAVALTAGAMLGARLAAASLSLYVLAGLFLPFYAGQEQGWTYATGATGGYLLGLVLSAWFVGLLAERAQDRKITTALPVMLLGSALVYAIGVPWLAHAADLSLSEAISKGAAPFLIGDVLKSVAVGLLLPAIWRIAATSAK